MKILQSHILFLVLTSCVVYKKTKIVSSKDVVIEIQPQITDYKINKWLDVFVVVKNNSNQDITILKPSLEYAYQMNFFKVKYLCEDQAITMEPYSKPVIKKTELDLINVKANSETSLKLKGNLYDVICNDSKITEVKVIYDTTKELSDWIIGKIGVEQNEIKNRLTKIRVESKAVTIE